MRRSEMVSKLKTLVSNLRNSNVNVSDKMFAETILDECERNGMLPPGYPVSIGMHDLMEHSWEEENQGTLQ